MTSPRADTLDVQLELQMGVLVISKTHLAKLNGTLIFRFVYLSNSGSIFLKIDSLQNGLQCQGSGTNVDLLKFDGVTQV